VTGVNWLSIVALLGWLVLALGAYRAHRIGARQAIVMALAWLGLFLLVAGVFTLIQ
jgi:hypothetical protein